MKEYFVFKLNENLANIYRGCPRSLFSIFNRIYYMKMVDIKQGINFFDQVACFLNKKDVNDFLYNTLKNKMFYVFSNNEHIINNLYNNEVSILEVKNTHIKITTNADYPSFIDILSLQDSCYFVCEFKNQEYFFARTVNSIV